LIALLVFVITSWPVDREMGTKKPHSQMKLLQGARYVSRGATLITAARFVKQHLCRTHDQSFRRS